ncbi:hypothetical protein NDU88_005805 [Pleurodeles waltl]|uniref:Uncharacterized protein n=1 Tax=Pleurodeles waltl TaxID=8319 RepID=A0AAV7TD03_PLEWA|nr:hypothetical protein NDU88_005805 [Pleurodeles waltl]
MDWVWGLKNWCSGCLKTFVKIRVRFKDFYSLRIDDTDNAEREPILKEIDQMRQELKNREDHESYEKKMDGITKRLTKHEDEIVL